MSAIGDYLLGVTAAALLCALVKKLPLQASLGSAVGLLAAVFMALSVVAPWVQLRLNEDTFSVGDIRDRAQQIASEGEKAATMELRSIISGRVGTYILDKATSLGACLEVEVTLSDDMPVQPVAVKIKGDVSPYAKAVLQEYIQDYFGISTEAQTWNRS